MRTKTITATHSLELSPPVFSILSALIEEQVGLRYGLSDRELLRERASTRAVEAGFDSLLDYYYFLRYDPEGHKELSELVEFLVVGETYFFREWKAIETLVDQVIAPRCMQGEQVKVWSAACATGEEPLSLAMLLEDRGLLNQVDLFATDISERALSKARLGRFGKRSLRNAIPKNLEKYVHFDMESYIISPKLIDKIHWHRGNLLRAGEIRKTCGIDSFDITLCRNVLIYFSDETVKKVLNQVWQIMSPGSLLSVGVSESLLRYESLFINEEIHGNFFYRKPVSSLVHNECAANL